MFNLSRYFSILSFLLMALAALTIGALYREISLHQMQILAESRNLALVQVLRNSLGEALAEQLQQGVGQAEARTDLPPATERLRQRLGTLLQGTAIQEISLHNRLGVSLLHSDPEQSGRNLLDDADFRRAMAGEVSSALAVPRDPAGRSAGERLVTQWPWTGADGAVLGVLRISQDVTPFAQALKRDGWLLTGGLLGVFVALYLLQYLVVRQAQHILREQAGRIAAARDTLEVQVAARTDELRRINQRLEAEVAERRQAESRLNYLAYHDTLTGLSNRRAFIAHLERSIGERQPLGVLFIDLDQFKQVNDSLGHIFGDELLVAVAGRLSEQVRLVDRLARLGGDEFIALIEEPRDGDELALVAGEIGAAFAAPFVVAEKTLYLSASIGISRFPEDGDSVGELLRNADSAMYQAKAAGRGGFRFYESAMTVAAHERIRLENLLHQALDEQAFEVYLQPQVDAESGRLVGAEALLRWFSRELGPVPPSRFIPLAEETGMIFPLGDWVLRESCRQVMAWRAAGFALPHVSVNLSVRQLQRPGFVATLMQILDETGLEPACLKLELTESVLLGVDDPGGMLQALRDLGVTLALDDFGTGYSSLSYLKALPVQQLKIDRSFVQGIGRNSGDEAIIRTIMELARSLAFEVVAEGVETAEQAAFLTGLGCDSLQGYLHGAAVTPQEFHARWRSDL